MDAQHAERPRAVTRRWPAVIAGTSLVLGAAIWMGMAARERGPEASEVEGAASQSLTAEVTANADALWKSGREAEAVQSYTSLITDHLPDMG